MNKPTDTRVVFLFSRRELGVLALLLAVLSGCGENQPDNANEVRSLEQFANAAYAQGHNWQGDVLADGDVTIAEYDEANRRNRECLKSHGLQPGEQVRDRVNGFSWDYEISHSSSLDEMSNVQIVVDCSVETMIYVETAMWDWGDWSTDPAVMHSVETCVAEQGFISDSEFKNYRELTMYFKADGISEEVVPDCISDAMNRLYPNEAFAISYF